VRRAAVKIEVAESSWIKQGDALLRKLSISVTKENDQTTLKHA
jgi:hypothetical protein